MRSKVKQAGLSGRLWAIAGFVLMGSLGVIQTATSAPLALPMTEPEEQGISTTRFGVAGRFGRAIRGRGPSCGHGQCGYT